MDGGREGTSGNLSVQGDIRWQASSIGVVLLVDLAYFSTIERVYDVVCVIEGREELLGNLRSVVLRGEKVK